MKNKIRSVTSGLNLKLASIDMNFSFWDSYGPQNIKHRRHFQYFEIEKLYIENVTRKIKKIPILSYIYNRLKTVLLNKSRKKIVGFVVTSRKKTDPYKHRTGKNLKTFVKTKFVEIVLNFDYFDQRINNQFQNKKLRIVNFQGIFNHSTDF